MPTQDNALDWLALIQHYGGPTRLLDFTYSLYVSAFFAIETATKDSAIWAINLHELNLATQEKLCISAQGYITDIQHAHNLKFEELVSKKSQDVAVIHVEPDKLHDRLWMQQGLFLAPTNPNIPFEVNLIETFQMNADSSDFNTETPWSNELVGRLSPLFKDDKRIYVLKMAPRYCKWVALVNG